MSAIKTAKQIFTEKGYPNAGKEDYASFNSAEILAMQLDATTAAWDEAIDKIENFIDKDCKGHTECGRCEQTKFLAYELKQSRDKALRKLKEK